MKDKNQRIYQSVLISIIIFSCSFIAFIGYLNFKTYHKEIQNQIYREITNESIERIENAIRFGKSLENYYGMDQIFLNIKAVIGEEIELAVTDTNGSILYCSINKDDAEFSQINAAMSGVNVRHPVTNIELEEKSQTFSAQSRNYIMQPIKDQDKISGLFFVTYKESMINNQLGGILFYIFIITCIIISIVLILFKLIYSWINRMAIEEKKKEKLIVISPIILIMTAIIIQSIFSIFVYQDSYKSSILSGGRQILSDLNESISNVLEAGVKLEDVDGVTEYLAEKVEKIPIIRNVRIYNEIANAANYSERDNELTIIYNLHGEAIKLSAELSAEYINNKIMQIVLLMISTLIIVFILIIEIIKLPGLILYCNSSKKNTVCDESYKQVSNALRLTSFLCSTAEYICVPFAAMIIRDMNTSVFGLSVGMTAALPMSLEGLAQIIGMLALPKFINKIDIKTTLILSGVMMAVCNIMAFRSNTAMTIIIFRGLAGIAYSGFKQVSNYLIIRGYQTELQRSANLSQDNAGLLGGITCGAGLGAIISATVGYSATFVISVFVFFVYVIISLYIIPWQWLKGISKREKKSGKTDIKKIGKMIFSWEMIRYIILIGIPLNIGIMLCITLIPGICQSRNISTLVLSYCYIVNGIAGIYIGPALVNMSKKIFGLKKSIGFAFAITGISIYILELPFLAVMLIISSMAFGFLDGFTTPLAMDRFLELNVVKHTLNESAALVFCVLLFYVFTTIAPIIAELMLTGTNTVLSPLIIAAIIYVVSAVFLLTSGIHRKRMHEEL